MDEDDLINRCCGWQMFKILGGIAVTKNEKWFSLPTKDAIWNEQQNQLHLKTDNAIKITWQIICQTPNQTEQINYKQLTIF